MVLEKIVLFSSSFAIGTENAVLYAQWVANTYTVTFNKNGGDVDANPLTKTATYSKTIDSLPTAPTKAGYELASWNTREDGNGNVFDASTVVTSDITVYAKWTLKNYSITYVLSGGNNNAANPATYTSATPTINMQNPSRDGYEFLGWYADAGFSTLLNQIPQGSTGDKTIYAKWNLLNTEKQITAYSFKASVNSILNSDVTGTVNHNTKVIEVIVPGGTDVSLLKPTFTISSNASISISGTNQVSETTASNFNQPVTYKVTAQDGSSNEYVVNVIQEWKTSGSVLSYVIPAGVNSIRVKAWGAAGGDFYGSASSKGALVTSTLSVTPGETIQLRIGGKGGPGHANPKITGAGGWNGGGDAGPVGVNGGAGGGGGATDVRKSPFGMDNRVIVAGGGGGGPGALGTGGQVGANGQGGSDNPGGNGATQSAVGAATVGATGQNGFAGIGAVGGAGGGAGGHRYSGGGGGGGYFGGSGGGCEWNGSGGGGGGGSSYGPDGTVYSSGADADNSGNGKITITPLS